MGELRFEWDPAKAESNLTKHGVSFEEAATVFSDESALLISDPDHAPSEDRFVLLGMSARSRVLTVCHCDRGSDDVIRLISARKAGRHEREAYFRRFGS